MHGGTVRQIQLETCRRTKCKLNNGNNMNFRKQTIKTDILTYVYTYSTCRMCLLWVPSKHFHCPKKIFLKAMKLNAEQIKTFADIKISTHLKIEKKSAGWANKNNLKLK